VRTGRSHQIPSIAETAAKATGRPAAPYISPIRAMHKTWENNDPHAVRVNSFNEQDRVLVSFVFERARRDQDRPEATMQARHRAKQGSK
jgi:hypothetical protein